MSQEKQVDSNLRKDSQKKKWIQSQDIPHSIERNEAMATARQTAQKKFGIQLKSWQAEAIAEAFAKKDVIISAGTGSGKSMVFQCLPYMSAKGIILVISPLLSLMHDQVRAGHHIAQVASW